MGICHPLIFLILSILLYSYMYKEQPLYSEYVSQIIYSRHRGVYTEVGVSFSVKKDPLRFQRPMGICHPLIFFILSILLYSYKYTEQPLCSEYASQILYSRYSGVYIGRCLIFGYNGPFWTFRSLWACVIPWFSWFYLSYYIYICIRSNTYIVNMRHKFFIVGIGGLYRGGCLIFG